MKRLLPFIFILGIVGVFFWQFLFKGLLPIPSDTIVGLYYPFREAYFKTNPNGLPFKNPLITDPVRQQIPWKMLSVTMEKSGELPVWNVYAFAGTPLLANFQSGIFYPLNLLFFAFPFTTAWSILIILEPFLAGIFLYLYLVNLKLNKRASILGAISFSLSGFFIAWLEWGNILHTALWLPLILLLIDKIIQKPKIIWFLVFLFSLVSSFFAGHLQTFFYLVLIYLIYFFVRWFQEGKKIKTLGLFIILNLIFLILILPQLIPTLQFISLSARNIDLINWSTISGWFIPWQNLIQFIAPDFFGNPATLNYYGVWNYGEFIGYIGLVPLIFSFFAIIFRRDKKTFFFGSLFFLSLILSLPTIFAKIPFVFKIPFLSTSQPTRLIFITDFALSVLTALGFDYYLKLKDKKTIFFILLPLLIVFMALWVFVSTFNGNLIIAQNLSIAKQNLILPTVLLCISFLLLIFPVILFRRSDKNRILFLTFTSYILILVTVFDLLRFGLKFESFTNQRYFFPSTSVTSFLQKQQGQFRIMANDSRIFPPNFSIMYKLQTLDGYDPLYLQRYGELMAANTRQKPDINSPFGFNRIITPSNPSSNIIALLGVKYVLSLNEIKDNQLKPVFSDGVIKVYENTLALPRAFFVKNTLIAGSKQEAINALFDINYQLNLQAVVEGAKDSRIFKDNWGIGSVRITDYQNNKVILETNNQENGFLVLTDSYYPTWHAKIDSKETKIYLTDYNFRGIIVPKGKHRVEYYITLF